MKTNQVVQTDNLSLRVQGYDEALFYGRSMKSWLVLAPCLLIACTANPIAPEPAARIDTFDSYVAAVMHHISKHWVRAEPYNTEINCVVTISQDRQGMIQSVEVNECNGSESEVLEIERAIQQSSPLPLPDDTSLFDPIIRVTFCPSC